MKLLIVDDNPINQKYLYYSLKKYYEIATANNGLEAVELLEMDDFDVVLMDLFMPVMDGAIATQLIRKSENFRNKQIPIIFITTSDYEHDCVRCIENGGDAYLIKPVDIQELLTTIELYLIEKQEVK